MGLSVESRFHINGREIKFSLLLCPNQQCIPIRWVTAPSHPTFQKAGHDTDHSTPFSAEVKKVWSYIPPLPHNSSYHLCSRTLCNRSIFSLPEVHELTFEKKLSPSFTRGVVGNIRCGLITSEPFLRLYKLLITSSRSDVFLTGRNRLRGTLMPAIPMLGSQCTNMNSYN
jgi:hypothetical protein